PTFQQIDRQNAVQIIDQLQGVGIIAAQQHGQLIEDLSATIDHITTGLNQSVELLRLWILSFQRAELGSVIAHQLQEDARVGQIIAGAGGRKGSAITRAGDRVDGINDQPVVLQQDFEHSPATGLDPKGDGVATVALSQFAQPAMQRLGRVLQSSLFLAAGPVFKAEGMLIMAPVQSDPCHRRGRIDALSVGIIIHDQLGLIFDTGRRLYRQDVHRQHLRMRIRVMVTAPVERLRYARRASRLPYSYRSRTEIIKESFHWRKRCCSPSGVGVRRKAPIQTVNNTGEAIQTFQSAVSQVFNLQRARYFTSYRTSRDQRSTNCAYFRAQALVSSSCRSDSEATTPLLHHSTTPSVQCSSPFDQLRPITTNFDHIFLPTPEDRKSVV